MPEARSKQVSLQVKVSLLISVPILATLALSTFVSYRNQRERSLASMSLLASQTGEVIERALEHDMLVSDFDSIQTTFDSIGTDPRIRTLYLMDTSGRIVFAPHRQEEDQRLDNQDPSCQPCHALPPEERPSGIVVTSSGGEQLLRSMHPIENRAACARCHDSDKAIIGVLLTDLSISPIESALSSDLRNNLTWWVGTVFLTALLATLAVNRWVVRRLRQLASAMEQIELQEIAAKLPETPEDEIGRLSAGFNRMAAKVEAREQETEALSQELRGLAEERGQLLESTIQAQEEERKRVARELHDELGQGLGSTALAIELAQRTMAHDPAAGKQHLRDAHNLIADATDRMYDLILGLRPSVLDDLGLIAALRAHAQRTLEAADISFAIRSEGISGRLPAMIETALFRIFQEALTNVLRHSNAKHVQLQVVKENGAVRGEIRDDGEGFDPASLASPRPGGGGFGLMGMRERASQLGGRVTVESLPDKGTSVIVEIPLGEDRHA